MFYFFFSILTYLYYSGDPYVFLNDLSFFLSFSNINKFIDSSEIKFNIKFYFIITIVFIIFTYQLKSYLKEKKIAVFIIIYLLSNLFFLFVLIINDERYYLLGYGILILLLIDFLDKKLSLVKMKKIIYISVLFFSFLFFHNQLIFLILIKKPKHI